MSLDLPQQWDICLKLLTSNRHSKQQSRLLCESSPGECCQSKRTAQVVQSPAGQVSAQLMTL